MSGMAANGATGLTGATAPQWCLRLLNDNSTWSTWPLGSSPLLLGRGYWCQIFLDSANVSRVQCEVEMRGHCPWLVNRSKTNITLLNGAPVEESALKLGDVIEFAAYRLVLDLLTTTEGNAQEKLEICRTTQRFDESIFISGQADPVHPQDERAFAGDLLALLSLFRQLAKAASTEELLEKTRQHLETKFAPAVCCLALGAGADEVAIVYPATGIEDDVCHALLLQSMSLGEGVLHTPDSTKFAAMAAPLRHNDFLYGAIGLRRKNMERDFSPTSLHYLLALADGLAPLLLAAERLAQLQRDVEQERHLALCTHGLLGESKALAEVKTAISNAAAGRGNVLILGETGVGKELAARAVHDLSTRSHGPYITVNCAAIPEELFESELFGHERGAFTGALEARKGLFELAHGGTLFLDEVGELVPRNQARLLRAVESGTFRPVGSSREIAVDVRIVAATNRALHDTSDSRFRPDLFHRLGVYLIWIPPLRERKEDILLLARHYLKIYSQLAPHRPQVFTESAQSALREFPWPGNVRQLRNTIERACFDAHNATIQVEDLGLTPADRRSTNPAITASEPERERLLEVLRSNNGNVAASADSLGMPTSTLYYKLKKHRIYLRNPG